MHPGQGGLVKRCLRHQPCPCGLVLVSSHFIVMPEIMFLFHPSRGTNHYELLEFVLFASQNRTKKTRSWGALRILRASSILDSYIWSAPLEHVMKSLIWRHFRSISWTANRASKSCSTASIPIKIEIWGFHRNNIAQISRFQKIQSGSYFSGPRFLMENAMKKHVFL